MSLATITFWGESFNVYGIPDELYIYLISITVNQAMGNGDKIVRIVPVSEDAPTFYCKESKFTGCSYEGI